MNIKKLMTRPPVTIHVDEPLSQVKAIFEEKKFHHLLVVSRGVLVGIISDRDLLKSLNPRVDKVAATTADLACLNKKAHQIMTRKLITLDESATVKDAIETFNANVISCIPVVNGKGKPVGILSWRDIMRALIK